MRQSADRLWVVNIDDIWIIIPMGGIVVGATLHGAEGVGDEVQGADEKSDYFEV